MTTSGRDLLDHHHVSDLAAWTPLSTHATEQVPNRPAGCLHRTFTSPTATPKA